METFAGIPGRFTHRTVSQYQSDDSLWFKQVFVTELRSIKYWGEKCTIRASIRYDDECGNRHNSFAITGTIWDSSGRDIAGGCLHDEIAKAFPEIKHLIKYHLFSSDGPLHYISNTLYLAGDRDCHGLKKGEKRPIKNGKTGKTSLELVYFLDGVETPVYQLPKYITEGEKRPIITAAYKVWCRTGEGKERELDSARSAACWPDATDEELSAEPEILKQALESRLPALIEQFKTDIVEAGMLWIPTPEIIEQFKGKK